MWNLFQKKESMVAGPVDVCADPIQPFTFTCSKCYGVFEEKGMRFVSVVMIHVRVIAKDEQASLWSSAERENFCTACAPAAELLIKVVDDEGDELDTRGFTLCGHLQDIDLATHENMFLVDQETHGRIFCNWCGEPMEVKGEFCKPCVKAGRE